MINCVYLSLYSISDKNFQSIYKEEKIVSTLLFEDDAIMLDLPLDPVNGWKIFPLSHPKVIHVFGDCSATG